MENRKLSYYLGGILLLLCLRSILIIDDLLTALVFIILGTSVLFYGNR